MTIDGEHARDFDDAISIEKLPNGHYWLGVHIADVAHYVTEGSALDQEGYERATSVYFPERAVHMFPSELATGICSLNPRVDRLVQTCLMEVDANGSVVRHEFHDGVINTAARMTYTDVNAILTTKPPELMQQVPRPGAEVRADGASCSTSSTGAASGAARSISICRRPKSSSTTPARSRRSSKRSATSRTS